MVASIVTKTEKALQWDKLKEHLANEASSIWAKELAYGLNPQTDLKLADNLLRQTQETASILSHNLELSFAELPDIRNCLTRLKILAKLAPEEFNFIKAVLVLSYKTSTFLQQLNSKNYPVLSAMLPGLHALPELVSAIEVIVDQDNSIRNEASALLAKLHKDSFSLTMDIKAELLKIINSPPLAKVLQEPFYTQRNGRYVLPVNSSMRQFIKGIVHDSSASGLTIYLEPFVVIELTNKVRLIEAEIEREIDRLLAELSSFAATKLNLLEETYHTLVNLDLIFAKAKLSQKYKGTCPNISCSGPLVLKSARHPLLVLQKEDPHDRVVPNDISLEDKLKTLVITGPNTGGKTVLLKTVGILSLMVASGLLLPVAPGSSCIIFRQVLADIGDDQSLEQNLSTFSSHMTNIIDIVNKSGEGALVLLDEIGAGTDPYEGAAIGAALLEHLSKSQAYTIATTHLSKLKNLAYTTPGISNASLDFDEATFSPTYKLRLGSAGCSYALPIALGLGLNISLIRRAEEFLKASSQDTERMIEELETKSRMLSVQEQAIEARLEKIAAQETATSQKLAEAEDELAQLKYNAADKLEAELREARKSIKNLIAQLQRQPSIAQAQEAQTKIEHIRQQLGWDAAAKNLDLAYPKIGQKVKIGQFSQIGIIEDISEGQLPNSNTQALVRIGNVKIKVPLATLTYITDSPEAKSAGSKKPKTYSGQSPLVQKRKLNKQVDKSAKAPDKLSFFVKTQSNYLDLRGQRVDEAIANLERFIDESFLTQTSPILIVHGHGTGAIKAAVRNFLGKGEYGIRYRPGEAPEGGDGVTIVEFV